MDLLCGRRPEPGDAGDAPGRIVPREHIGDNQTTVRDESAKLRRITTDGLGRLVEVVEDPSVLNYTTC